MNEHQHQTIGIDKHLLKVAVQDELNGRRNELGDVNILDVQFQDGAWCVLIRFGSGKWPADCSGPFSEIEESMVDKYGVNVVLRPANE